MNRKIRFPIAILLLIGGMSVFFSSCQKDNPRPAEVNSISVKAAPTIVYYYIGEFLDLSGLVVTLTLDNGETEDIAFSDFESKGITCSPENGSEITSELIAVTITHEASRNSTSQSITVSAIFTDITDIDSNNYPVVKIGNQIWMAENLRTTTYNDGTPITLVDTDWNYPSTEAYCWYNNDEVTYGNLNGALYNWYALENENLCPEGWYVPTDADWKILEGFVDSQFGIDDLEWNESSRRGFDAGMKLKTTTGWDNYRNGINGTNNYGFNAYPSGYRASSGHFTGITSISQWWSFNKKNEIEALRRYINHNSNTVGRNTTSKSNGYSVRCIKDTE